MARMERPAHPQRWQRRDERLRSERRRMKKHGAGVRRVYPAAVRKRLKRQD